MTKENLTEIVAIVDRSSSMGHLTKETIHGFNQFLAEQKKEPGDANFTLATFADDYSLVYDAIPLADVPDLNKNTYNTGGYTALLDAMGRTINSVGERLAAMKEEDRPSKVLFLIMTDGEENSSAKFVRHQISNMISHQREKYSWQFVYIGANQDSVAVGSSMGIPSTNSYNYAASTVGTASMFSSVTKGVSSYRGARIGSSYEMPSPIAASPPMPDLVIDVVVNATNSSDKDNK